jgi:hypothetical protein
MNNLGLYKKARALFIVTMLLGTISLAGCSAGSIETPASAELTREGDQLFIDLTINTVLPESLEENLTMYSNTFINCSITARAQSGKNAVKVINRVVEYDRWKNIYLITDSDSSKPVKFISFDKLSSRIFSFNNKQLMMIDGDFDSDLATVTIECTLKSTNFAPPFNLIEDSFRFGNMKIKKVLKEIPINDKQ